MLVCLTGKAHNNAGVHIPRSTVKAAAVSKGYIVQDAFNSDTQMLVASRDDTVKAIAAKARGVVVLTYPEFFEMVSNTPLEVAGHNV